MKRRIANVLEPGETVLQALRRLKGNSDRKAKMSAETKVVFDQLTEDAMKLMENDVYHEKREVFDREAGVGGTHSAENPSFWSTSQPTLRRTSGGTPGQGRNHLGRCDTFNASLGRWAGTEETRCRVRVERLMSELRCRQTERAGRVRSLRHGLQQ
ncbi:uncharacterized protein HKW66_Vig0050400 [Vigna angularis]|uniref:Uncharacterized protein n=1 Tax=Phaseolus angularis TaxID=3914 RepID=A0A8T0L714_PHAAN|nr:uncharacterized protein HKW66_Vig0050400 [Vigna angularis]